MQSITNYPLLLIAGLIGLVLVAWLVYRNFKDEKKLEQNLNDPKQDKPVADNENE